MAEIIDLINEESIPELEAMLMLLFEKDEVKAIVNLRSNLSYKMNRTPKTKHDCFRFIDNELKLLRIIKLRQKKNGLPRTAKLTLLESSLKDRIHKLFNQCIRWFSNDIRVWMTYIRFCQKNRSAGDTGRVLDQMLKVHGSAKPHLFKVAADWELNKCKNVEKARAHLTNGIHLHKDSKLLLKDLFKLELHDAEMKRKACIANDIHIDPTNPHLTSKKAECIYEMSIKKLKDVELMNDLMNICEEYIFASNLLSKISNDMFEFENNEKMWDIIANRELKGDEKASPKVKIGKLVALYETAVKRLNTPLMWSYYLEALLELLKDSTVLPNFKRKLLLTAFKKADSVQKLSEKYYLMWVAQLHSSDKHKQLVEVLTGAVKQPHLVQSKELWYTLLREHLKRGEDKQAAQVFEQGAAALGSESLPMWKLMIQYEQTKRNNKVEEIFKKSWSAPREVYCALAPMYLEWLILSNGIAAARKVYELMYETGPPCPEIHKQMIYLESIQPTLNFKRMRLCHTMACSQFGTRSVDVWMDYVKFEAYSGDPFKMGNICRNAMQTLDDHLVETFLSEYGLVQTVPPPSIKS